MAVSSSSFECGCEIGGSFTIFDGETPGPGDGHRGAEADHALRVLGPDARLQPSHRVAIAKVDWLWIHSDGPDHPRKRCRHRRSVAHLAMQDQIARCPEWTSGSDIECQIREEQGESGTASEIHPRQGSDLMVQAGEGNEEPHAPSNFVGLNRASPQQMRHVVDLRTDEPDELIGRIAERAARRRDGIRIEIRIVAGQRMIGFAEQQIVHRGEKKDRNSLSRRGRRHGGQDLWFGADSVGEAGVQRCAVAKRPREESEPLGHVHLGCLHGADCRRRSAEMNTDSSIILARMDPMAVSTFLADLDARGLIHDATDRDALAARLADGPIGVYVGFDPTADSLHVGNLLGQVMLRRFQLAGHRPVVLAGGATGMVGDPGGRSEERNLLDRETLAHNVAGVKRQLERILDFGPPNAARLVDNADWTAPMGVLEFLRDVGKHFTVNQMVAKESVRARMESEHGISYTEFSYMLLQAHDFYHLCRAEGVEMQMGGSDQWGNITAGIDLIRRRLNRPAFGLTWPLLTRSDGKKMGKSVQGALWLDPDKTSPYQFRQYWMQLPDEDVERFLLQLTLLEVDEITGIMADHREHPEHRLAQQCLAREVTTLVHGADAESAAAEATAVLFGGDPLQASGAALTAVAREVPTTKVPASDLTDLVSLLRTVGFATSNGEARRLLDQKGCRANGRVLSSEASDLSEVGRLQGRFVLLRKGKTTFHMVDVIAE